LACLAPLWSSASLERGPFPPFHYFGTSLIPFSLVVRKIESGRQRGWRRGELCWSSLLGCLTPGLRLYNAQETSSGFALYAHSFWDKKVFLYLAHLCKGQVTKVTSGSLWRLRLVEDFKIVFKVKYFNHLLLLLLLFLLLLLWQLSMNGWLCPQLCTEGLVLPLVHLEVLSLV